MTRTALVQKAIDDGDIDIAAYTARTPLHRFGEPDEIARAVLYLASGEAAWITGQILDSSGGCWIAGG